jgi:nicotinate dehydrogenase subunit A
MSTPEWATAPAPGAEQSFTLLVNATRRVVTTAPDTPLLYLLRNHLGLKGARFGCGLGQCGACMVLFDGHPTPSCDLPVWAAEGHEVVTVEGLAAQPDTASGSNGRTHPNSATSLGSPRDDGGGQVALGPIQRAFQAEQAAQCGYCMSGILISATALLRANPHPTEREVREALDRNLCRCGAHTRVIRAVLRAAEESP